MIKIIKEGTRKIEKCQKCGCEFSYEEEDINMVPHARCLSVTHYIRCPQCNNDIVLKADKNGR